MRIVKAIRQLLGKEPMEDEWGNEDDDWEPVVDRGHGKLSHTMIQTKVKSVVNDVVIADYGPDLECLPTNGFAEGVRLGFKRVLTDAMRDTPPNEDPYAEAMGMFTMGLAAGFRDFGMVFALSDKQKGLVEEATTDYYLSLQDGGVTFSLEHVVLPTLVISVSGGSIVLRGR